MLVLTRRENESIQIGPNVIISVEQVRGRNVRLGIQAPPEVPILRGELVKQPQQQGPHHILIVDDCPEDRYTCRRFLGGQSAKRFEIAEAESGEEGLRHCSEKPIDCVLLDYRLPDLTGLEFFEALRQQRRTGSPPVVLMTSQGDEALAVQAIKRGMVDYLVKGNLTRSTLQQSVLSAIHPEISFMN